jgi:hypothetical protein
VTVQLSVSGVSAGFSVLLMGGGVITRTTDHDQGPRLWPSTTAPCGQRLRHAAVLCPKIPAQSLIPSPLAFPRLNRFQLINKGRLTVTTNGRSSVPKRAKERVPMNAIQAQLGPETPSDRRRRNEVSRWGGWAPLTAASPGFLLRVALAPSPVMAARSVMVSTSAPGAAIVLHRR